VPAGVIVPALPEKNVVEKYKMTTEFIETRRAALTIFINRVVRAGLKVLFSCLSWWGCWVLPCCLAAATAGAAVLQLVRWRCRLCLCW